MDKTQTQITDAAARLRQAQLDGTPCQPVRDLLPAGELDAAYAVQAANTAHSLAEGRRLVGRKIGLTAFAVQQQLGVDQPDYGMLFDDMMRCEGIDILPGDVLQPRIEAEIAFIVGRDLTDPRLTMVDLMRGLECAVAALEIVGSRVANWDIQITDTIADNASSGLFVLGSQPVPVSAVDYRLAGMVIHSRGEPVSVGATAACLGSPLNAALWLARKMVDVGRPLMAGDVIMSGALGPMAQVSPGDSYHAQINGVGSVSCRFAA